MPGAAGNAGYDSGLHCLLAEGIGNTQLFFGEACFQLGPVLAHASSGLGDLFGRLLLAHAAHCISEARGASSTFQWGGDHLEGHQVPDRFGNSFPCTVLGSGSVGGDLDVVPLFFGERRALPFEGVLADAAQEVVLACAISNSRRGG